MDEISKALLDNILAENKRLQKENLALREENIRFKIEREQLIDMASILGELSKTNEDDTDDEDDEETSEDSIDKKKFEA